MSSRVVAVAAALACVVAAPAEAADITGSSITIEGFAGYHNLNINAPASSLAGATTTGKSSAIVGGDILAKLSLFGLGLSLDRTLASPEVWAGSIMAGLLFDLLPSLRLEALGEVGRYGAAFGDMFDSSGQTFLGLRPGVSFRLLPTPVRFGIGGIVRWPTSGGSFGSPNYGIVGKVGIELP